MTTETKTEVKKETVTNSALITIGETIGHLLMAVWAVCYLFLIGPGLFFFNILRGEDKHDSAIMEGFRKVVPKKPKAEGKSAKEKIADIHEKINARAAKAEKTA